MITLGHLGLPVIAFGHLGLLVITCPRGELQYSSTHLAKQMQPYSSDSGYTGLPLQLYCTNKQLVDYLHVVI